MTHFLRSGRASGLLLSTALCTLADPLFSCRQAAAATLVVTESTDDGTGTVPGSLSWVIANATDGDVVQFGTFYTLTVSGTLPAFTGDISLVSKYPSMPASRYIKSTVSVGDGTLTHKDNLYLTVDYAKIGTVGGAVGEYVVTGGSSRLNVNETISVGSTAEGKATLSDGGTIYAKNAYIGQSTGATGAVTVTGSSSALHLSERLYAGDSGFGRLDILDGGGVTSGSGILGTYGTGEGIVTISGAGSSWTVDDSVIVGLLGGTGTITVSGGGELDVGDELLLGGTSSASGNLNLTGTGTVATVTNDAIVGNEGTGVLTVSDGGKFSTGATLHVAKIGGSGTVNIGAAAGDAAAGAGTISADSLTFGSGTGTLVFNHTDTDYEFDLDVTGAGSLQVHSGTTILTGTVAHTGGTTISGGTLQVGDGGTTGSILGDITNNATLVFNRSDALAFGGDISGTGSLTKTGAGTLTLTGSNTHTGGTTLLDGNLVVNGTLRDVLLHGGTLGGSGTLGFVTANSGATIAPGNSIGTLTVTGSTSFGDGSTYSVEVDRNGNSDLLAVTGTVTIDNGATVTVSPENGTDSGINYAANSTYTIISAGAGVTGTFDSVTEDFAFLDAALSYSANDVLLTLTRNTASFTSVAQTPNELAVAGSLVELGSGSVIQDAVVALDESAARSAFNSLSGEIHASVNNLMIRESRLARDAVTERIRGAFASVAAGDQPMIAYHNGGGVDAPTRSDGLVAWGQAYGNWGTIAGDGNASSMDSTGSGFFLGVDRGFLGGWRAGVTAGYGSTIFDVAPLASSGKVDSYTFGAYGGGPLGNFNLRLGTAYSFYQIDTSRTVSAGTLTNALSINRTAATAQAFAEAGYSMETALARLEPFASGTLIHQRNAPVTETGGAAALTAEASSRTLGMSTIGLRAEEQVTAGESFTASLSGSLGWNHVYGDLDAITIMRFATGSDAFAVFGTPLDRDSALIDASVNLGFKERLSASVSYRGALGQNAREHGFSARLNARF